MNAPQGDALAFELYKLAVEMADRISARRATSNSFFLTVHTAFITIAGFALPALKDRPWWSTAAIAAAGLALSIAWWLQLRSYRDLNRAKFDVILEMEKELPKKIFTDEWNSLKTDPVSCWRGRYAELGLTERTLPCIFAALYLLLLIGRFWH
ncbi:hypothetical protein AB0K11_24695 [Mycobacterium sp. NPDC050551]|uniref:RipA family octameric membrane protein n=1 Tax=Mycobacterium sp. NPDC050551 TaxID=3155407 RepID=UPI0034314E58